MKKSKQQHSVRIIAGQWRGRRVPVLDSEGLRPTTDRVRETLFNWLMYDVQGARCLDLCAGTGVLSLEALSRGAESAVMVESNSRVAKQLQQTTELFAASAQIVQESVLSFLKRQPSRQFDLVFIDPPFALELQISICEQLEKNQWLTDDAMIYLEQARRQDDVSVSELWQLYRQGKTGQSRYFLYHRQV